MNKSLPTKNTAFWLSTQQRTTFMSVFGGLFGAGWILLHSPHAAQVLAPSSLPADAMARSSLNDVRGGYGRGERQDGDRIRQPLYLANLACQTGDYVVSVRRANSDSFRFDSNLPYGSSPANSEPLRLSLQVMSTRTGRIQKIDHINTELTVVDSAGHRLNLLEAGREFSIPDGMGCMFPLSAPDAGAMYLRSIDGVIHLVSEQSAPVNVATSAESSGSAMSAPPLSGGKSLPFHIANTPLPWKTRVFGLMGAAILDGNTARTLPLLPDAVNANQPVALQGAQMEAVVKRMPQTAFQSALRPPQPNLLALTADTPNTIHIRAPAPALPAETRLPGQSFPLTCVVTPHIQPNGRLQATVEAEGTNGSSLTSTISTWDNVPVLLIVPASRLFPDQTDSAILALYLDLHLDNMPPDSLYGSALPATLRAKKGEVGGALSGEIVTSKGAFGLGRAKLNVRHWSKEGVEDKKPENILVALDKSGKFNLSNLAAGRYEFEPGEVEPYQSPAIARCSFAEFLLQHFDIRQAKVNSAGRTAVVKAGNRVELPPWIFAESK